MAGMHEDAIIDGREHPISRYLNPVAMSRNLWAHRHLLRQLVVREVAGRYRGSLLGSLWAVITPLCMLAVYAFVFSVIFQLRLATRATESRFEFALSIFSGLIVFNVFSECVNRAPSLIVSNASYVKRVVYPLEVLPLSVLASSLFFAGISIAVLLAAVGFFMRTLSIWLLCLPLVLLPLALLTAGLAWFLASLGVFLRDIGHIIAVALQMMFFLTPIFYSLDSAPLGLRPLLRLNPLATIVESGRQVLMFGEAPHWGWLAAVTALSAVVAQIGYAWFMKTKRGFADVL